MEAFRQEEHLTQMISNVRNFLVGNNYFGATNELKECIRTATIPKGKVVLLVYGLKHFIDWLDVEQRKIAEGVDDDAEDRFSAMIPTHSSFLKEIATIPINADPEDKGHVAMLRKVMGFAKSAFDAKYNYTGQKPELLAAYFEDLKKFFNEDHPEKCGAFYIAVKLASDFLKENKQFPQAELLPKMNTNFENYFMAHPKEIYHLMLEAIVEIDGIQNYAWKNAAELIAESLETDPKSDADVFRILISSMIFQFKIPSAGKKLRENVIKRISEAAEKLTFSQPNSNDVDFTSQCFTISTIMEMVKMFELLLWFQIEQTQPPNIAPLVLQEKKEILLAIKMLNVELAPILVPIGFNAPEDRQFQIAEAVLCYALTLLHEDPNNCLLDLVEMVTPLLTAENIQDIRAVSSLTQSLEQISYKDCDPTSEVGIAKQKLMDQLQIFKAHIKPPNNGLLMYNQFPPAEGPSTSNAGNSGAEIQQVAAPRNEPEVIDLTDDDDCVIIE